MRERGNPFPARVQHTHLGESTQNLLAMLPVCPQMGSHNEFFNRCTRTCMKLHLR